MSSHYKKNSKNPSNINITEILEMLNEKGKVELVNKLQIKENEWKQEKSMLLV